MLGVLAGLPFWAIYIGVAIVLGLVGALVAAPLRKNSPRLAMVLSVIGFAATKPISDGIVIPAIATARLNADLPKKVDDVTTLDRIEIDGRRYRYFNTLDASAAVPVGDELKAANLAGLCADWKPIFAEGGASSAQYTYFHPSGAATFLVEAKDCQ